MADGGSARDEGPEPWEDDPENVTGKYILVDRVPVACPSVRLWGAFMADHERNCRVAETYVRHQSRVSTVFLGLDHNHGRFFGGGETRPILFETMIFGWRLDGYQTRCCTWTEAETMHAFAVERVHRMQRRRTMRR
jgi:hypothetical protein